MGAIANSHIELIKTRNKQEKLLIASGIVFQKISEINKAISEVELAMELDISVAMVRVAIALLEKDGLVYKDIKGNWSLTLTR